jgi:hypothetical protein
LRSDAGGRSSARMSAVRGVRRDFKPEFGDLPRSERACGEIVPRPGRCRGVVEDPGAFGKMRALLGMSRRFREGAPGSGKARALPGRSQSSPEKLAFSRKTSIFPQARATPGRVVRAWQGTGEAREGGGAGTAGAVS